MAKTKAKPATKTNTKPTAKPETDPEEKPKKTYRTIDQRYPNVERASFLIPEWCARRRFSESMFYKERKAGRTPKETRNGKLITITSEADAEWVKEREAESQTEKQEASVS